MQILKVILWPHNPELEYREVNFELGKVNYIIGESNTGKSSIWPIIDYCLGSRKLRVPIGIVRSKVSWYGIVLSKRDEKILIARRNNTLKNSISEWFFEKNYKEVPKRITEKNIYSINMIKDFFSIEFNEFLRSLNQEIIDDFVKSDLGEFSYRDILSLNHQAQYAIVNPSSIFIEHTEDISIIKLKKLLPLILYERSHGQINLKRSSHNKKFHQISILKTEVDFLEQRMITLCNEAFKLKLTNSNLKSTEWPIERYVDELKYIISSNHELIESNEKRMQAFPKALIQKLLLLGKIKECLKFSKIIEKIRKLRYELNSLDSELKNEILLRKRSGFKYSSDLSETIHFYANSMKLEFSNLTPFFDEIDSTVKFIQNEETYINLSEFGSPRNYIGYNISVFLAFHQVLLKNKKSFVNPFLLIDHPSQGFSLIGKSEDKIKLQALADTLDKSVSIMNGEFQLIITDSALGNNIRNLPNSKLIETWDKTSKKSLIPNNW